MILTVYYPQRLPTALWIFFSHTALINDSSATTYDACSFFTIVRASLTFSKQRSFYHYFSALPYHHLTKITQEEKVCAPPETLATTGCIPKFLRCLIFLSTPCKQELLEIKKAHLHLADRGKKVISSRLPYACQRACKSEPTGSLM